MGARVVDVNQLVERWAKKVYPKGKVENNFKVEVLDIAYTPHNQKMDSRTAFQTQFLNDSSTEDQQSLKKSFTEKEQFTWSLAEGIKVGAEVEIVTGIPQVAEGKWTGSTELSFSAKQTSVRGAEETVAIETVIRVAARSRVSVDVVIERMRATFDWRGRVKVSGTVTVHNPNPGPVRAQHQTGYGILNGQPGFELVFNDDKTESWVEGPLSGSFEAVTGLSAVVNKHEAPVEGKAARRRMTSERFEAS